MVKHARDYACTWWQVWKQHAKELQAQKLALMAGRLEQVALHHGAPESFQGGLHRVLHRAPAGPSFEEGPLVGALCAALGHKAGQQQREHGHPGAVQPGDGRAGGAQDGQQGLQVRWGEKGGGCGGGVLGGFGCTVCHGEVACVRGFGHLLGQQRACQGAVQQWPQVQCKQQGVWLGVVDWSLQEVLQGWACVQGGCRGGGGLSL